VERKPHNLLLVLLLLTNRQTG